MPIGRANGQITAADINLEFGQGATAQIGLRNYLQTYGVNTGGIPRPNTDNNIKMSGYLNSDGFHGYTRGVAKFDGTNDYIASLTALPSEMQLTYTTPFSISMWVYNAYPTNPIATGYQPRLFYIGSTTFGARTMELFYEGKLSNGSYSNKIIARLVRSAFATGRRDYRWDLALNGKVTNGNGWNSTNSPGWIHLVLTYDGAGAAAGAFQLYWNGQLMTVNQTNNLNDSSNVWSYNGTERFWVGTAGYATTNVNAWRFSGWGFYNYRISASEVTTLYNQGAGVGCNAINSQCHWWGFSGNADDRSASYPSGGSTWPPYSLIPYNSPTYDYTIRPSK